MTATIEPHSGALQNSLRLDSGKLDFTIRATGQVVHVIGLVPHQIITHHARMEAKVVNGFAVSDPERDLLKIAVIERHTGKASTGLGFVTGFGLKAGAIGSSVAHDSHNIVVVGATDDDMNRAVQEICSLGGGQVVVKAGRVIESLALPIAGLISDRPLQEVAGKITRLREAARRELGCKVEDPFMSLSFLALPPIPRLKLTDQGLIDAVLFKPIPLFSSN
jgi:adenine deaminase